MAIVCKHKLHQPRTAENFVGASCQRVNGMVFFVLALAALAIANLPLATPAHAVQPQEMLDDPALEQRARKLSAGLRCLVCQNQNIDESDAPLARDLRRLVRERLRAGDTDAQVTDYLVERYGEFVLLRPPFALHTLLLWLAPLFVLVGAIWVARRTALHAGVRSGGTTPAPELSDAEKKTVKVIVSALPRERRQPRQLVQSCIQGKLTLSWCGQRSENTPKSTFSTSQRHYGATVLLLCNRRSGRRSTDAAIAALAT